MRTLSLAVVVVLLGCGQPAPRPRVVAVTDVGTPTGAPTTLLIGPEGGSLSTPDGKLTLTVPAGAVASPTMFSVTPITATGPGAARAWRLGPEGTRFSTPATISMTYDADEAKASEPRFWRIAYQDALRRWRALASTTVNESTRVLSATTTHLSDWMMLKGYSLAPNPARVKVGTSLTFRLQTCDTRPPDEDDLAPLMGGPIVDDLNPIGLDCVDEELAPLGSQAFVNGVQGGNATFGTVRNQATAVVFTAPARKPSPELVAVSLRFNSREGLTTVVSNVTIFDDMQQFPAQLNGTFTFSQDWGGPGTGSSKLRLSMMGNATFSNRNEEGSYKGAGTVNVTGGFVDLPNCDCDVAGGMASFDGSLLLTPTRYSWGFGASIPLALSCRLRPSRTGPCPSEHIVPINFSSGAAACPGTATTTYSKPDQLMGSYSRTCVLGPSEVTWSFMGQ